MGHWGRLLIGQLALADEAVGWGGGGSTDRSQDHPPLPGVSADYRVRPAAGTVQVLRAGR